MDGSPDPGQLNAARQRLRRFAEAFGKAWRQAQRIATHGETPRPNPTRPAAGEKAGEKGTEPFEFRGPVPFSPAGPPAGEGTLNPSGPVPPYFSLVPPQADAALRPTVPGQA